MERKDEELIERLMPENDELRRYIEEHRTFEKILDEFNQKPHLTPLEEIERKKVKKLKLKGKDKIEEILSRYR